MFLTHPVALAPVAVSIAALGLSLYPHTPCSAQTRPVLAHTSLHRTAASFHRHWTRATTQRTPAGSMRTVRHTRVSNPIEATASTRALERRATGVASVSLTSSSRTRIASSGMQQLRALGSSFLAASRLPGIAGIGKQVHVTSAIPGTRTVSGIVTLDSIASVTVLTSHGSQTIKLTPATRYLVRGRSAATKPTLHAGERAVIVAVQVKGMLLGQAIALK